MAQEAHAREIEALVAGLEAVPDPGVRARAQELVQAVLELHATGLRRVLDLAVAQGEAGRALVAALGDDALTGGLLALHGLHPRTLEERVRAALDEARPQLAAQGCALELVVAAEAGVRVRLERRAFGFPSTPETLRGLVEDAVAARAPDAGGLAFEGEITPAKGEVRELVQLRVTSAARATERDSA